MRRRILGSTCVAGLLAATVAFAQGSSQAPTQAPQGNSQQRPSERSTATDARRQTDQQVTLTGCVMREGVSDFVLASAMPTGASGNLSGGVSGSTSTGPTGTSGTSAGSATAGIGTAGARYRLSGERDLSSYVGQRVEIVGRMDAAATPSTTGNGSTSGIGSTSSSGIGAPSTSGTSSGSTSVTPGASTSSTSTTPRGTSSSTATVGGSAAGQTAAMQHVTITSVRAVGGSCQ